MPAPKSTPKALIVNGSLNPSLDLCEILEHYGEQKQLFRAAWSLIVNMGVCWKVEGLMDSQQLTACLEAAPEQTMRRIWEQHERERARHTGTIEQLERDEGAALARIIGAVKRQNELRLPLTHAQARGFVSVQEGFNRYCPKAMARVIEAVAARRISLDYGPNNPNTAAPTGHWVFCGDAWEFIAELKAAQLEANHLEAIIELLQSAGADSVSREALGRDTYCVRAWWD